MQQTAIGGKGNSGHCLAQCLSPNIPSSHLLLLPPLFLPPPLSTVLTTSWDGEQCCYGLEGGPLQLLLLLVFLLDSAGLHLGLDGAAQRLNLAVNACTQGEERERQDKT